MHSATLFLTGLTAKEKITYTRTNSPDSEIVIITYLSVAGVILQGNVNERKWLFVCILFNRQRPSKYSPLPRINSSDVFLSFQISKVFTYDL